MIFDFLRKLGSGAGTETSSSEEKVEYNGYAIVPEPQKEAGGWRIQGTISREVEGVVKSHTFIRADIYPGRDDAISTTISKAKRIVDEQGDRMFR